MSKIADIALLNIKQTYPDAYLVIACEIKEQCLQIKELNHYWLIVAYEKVQLSPPFNYLGRIIRDDYTGTQQIEIRRDN